jgi:hypothetical protein
MNIKDEQQKLTEHMAQYLLTVESHMTSESLCAIPNIFLICRFR